MPFLHKSSRETGLTEGINTSEVSVFADQEQQKHNGKLNP